MIYEARQPDEVAMKLLLQDDNIEYVRSLCLYLGSHNISATVSGDQTFETAPGAVLRMGLWISDEAQFDEALALVKSFDEIEVSRRPTSADFGFPNPVRNYERLAKYTIVCVIVVLSIYVLA